MTKKSSIILQLIKKNLMSKLPEGFNPEQKEEEKKSPIFIIYRDNDLFQKQIPEMVKILSSMGRQVEVQSFPKETNKEEIEEWYKENLERLAGMEMISDITAGIPFNLYKEFKSQGTKSRNDLDDLISKVIKKAIWGEGVDNKTLQRFPSEKEFYSGIMKRILENQENMPNKIYLFLDHITDHMDIKEYAGIGLGDDKDLCEYMRYGKIFPIEDLRTSKMTYKEIPEHYKKKREDVIAKYLEETKKSLIQSGIDVEKIIIKSDRPSAQELQEIDQPNNWVIIDRHSKIFDGRNKLASAKNLGLPLGSFYNDAREAGLINIPEKEFNQNLEKVLDEELGN